NLGRVTQPVQTIMAANVASATTEDSGEGLQSFTTVGLAAFSTSGGVDGDSQTVQLSNDAATTSALDLVFYESEADDNEFSIDSLVDRGSDEAGDEALLLALEEEFGSVL